MIGKLFVIHRALIDWFTLVQLRMWLAVTATYVLKKQREHVSSDATMCVKQSCSSQLAHTSN